MPSEVMEFLAKIRWETTNEGGRLTPPVPGIHISLFFKAGVLGCTIWPIGTEASMRLGEEYLAIVEIIAGQEEGYFLIVPEANFTIQEGRRVVGHGEVLPN